MTFSYWVLALMVVALLFWRQRQQDERATALARQLCQAQQIQFLECARVGYRRTDHAGRKGFFALYQVDFSGDGESRYQAELWLRGNRLSDFRLPAFRI
jgi:hypothetical protein